MSELPESRGVEDRQAHATPDMDDAFAPQQREIAANRFKRQPEMIGNFRTRNRQADLDRRMTVVVHQSDQKTRQPLNRGFSA
jgi:hypothetical protein